MNLFSFIDRIYENENFKTILLYSIIILIILFVIVLFLGIRDKKRSLNPKKNKEDDIKDITFELPNEQEKIEIKEDVTFEITSLTKNLEDFKKSLEEEMEREDEEIEIPLLEEMKEAVPTKEEKGVNNEKETSFKKNEFKKLELLRRSRDKKQK